MKKIYICLMILLSMQLVAGNLVHSKQMLQNFEDKLAVNRPWEKLHDSNRGILAYVINILKKNNIPKQARQHLYEDLDRLLTLKTKEQIAESTPKYLDYQKKIQIDVFSLWKSILLEKTPKKKWGKQYKDAYYSNFYGNGILFDVILPPKPIKNNSLPLLIHIKSGPKVIPDVKYPYILVRAPRHGLWAPNSITGYEVLRIIDHMIRYYPIDEDRIYIAGQSAGASEMMHIVARKPDLFAAALAMIAIGSDFPVVNFRNLPVSIYHGDSDWTSSICNVYVQMEKLKKIGCPIKLITYRNCGHYVPRPHEPLIKWMFKQKLIKNPKKISIEAEVPEWGKAYGITIYEFINAHQRASIDVDHSVNITSIKTRNISVFSINTKRLPLDEIEIDNQRIKLSNKDREIFFRLNHNKWNQGEILSEPKSKKRKYSSGAAANLYQGEPLMIVFGTGAKDPKRNRQLRQAAENMACYAGPGFSKMKGERVPIVADTAVTAQQIANYNLILIGRPEENSIMKELLPDLPISLKKNILTVAKRSPMSLKGQVLSMLALNYKFPKKLIYLVVPFVTGDAMQKFCHNSQLFLAGSDGMNRISQADLIVQDTNNRIARQMQYGKNWQWLYFTGENKKIPLCFRNRSAMSKIYIKIMHKQSGADYALWWGPSDKRLWNYDFNYLRAYNPSLYTLADFKTQHRNAETMTGNVSGKDLHEIWNRWGSNQEIIFYPKFNVENIDMKKQYRLHIPQDLYIKLGQRKKNLNSPRPAKEIQSEYLIPEIFKIKLLTKGSQ